MWKLVLILSWVLVGDSFCMMRSECLQGLTRSEQQTALRFSEQCGVIRAFSSIEEFKTTKTRACLDVAVESVLSAIGLFGQQTEACTFDSKMSTVLSAIIESCITELSMTYQMLKKNVTLTPQIRAKLQSIGILK